MGNKKVQFLVYLCSDSLLEALHWGQRRQLAMLELVGQRFNRFVEGYFSERPFLLMIEIDFQYFSYAFIFMLFNFKAKNSLN